MMINVGINGFGRIGRITLRVILAKYLDKIKVVAINNPGSMSISDWAHLFEYDSVYGRFKGRIEFEEKTLIVNHQRMAFFEEKEPAKIPWKKYNIDVVIESSGVFRERKLVSAHLDAGAKKVVVSATAKGIKSYVLGVNENEYKGELMVSNASCTTNCVAVIAKIIKENFGLQKALLSTIHSYTASQNLVDASHRKDLRRARAAGINIIPTSTGAAKATMEVLPDLKGLFNGLAFRVPVSCISVSDVCFVTTKRVTIELVNKVLKEAALREYRGILEVTNKPLVSTDVIGCSASALVDLSLTQVVDGDLLKVIAWYDNEWGYCCRLVELADYIFNKK